MRKKIITVAFIIIITFYGCNNSSKDVTIKESSQNDTTDRTESDQCLTLSIPMYFGSIVDIVHQYEKAHPNVKIEVQSAVNEGEYFYDISMDVFNDYVLQMATDVMSSTDIDIYETGYLPYFKYSGSNAFENLYDYMNEDPDFDQDDYYTNIFEALSDNGKLYLLPHHFSYNLVRLNRKYVDDSDVDSIFINYKQLESLYTKAKQTHPKEAIDFSLNRSAYSYSFNAIELSSQLDLRNGQIISDPERFKEYLEFEKVHLPHTIDEKLLPYDCVDPDPSDNKWFMNCFSFGLTNVNETSDAVSKPYLLSASNNDLQIQLCGGLYSISSHSKSKKLAWDFLMFMIEEKDYDFDSYDWKDYPLKIEYNIGVVSVNRNNFIKSANQILGERYERDVKEDVEFWDSINKSVDHVIFTDSETYDIFYDIISDYEKDLIDVDECIQIIQDKANIYLHE